MVTGTVVVGATDVVAFGSPATVDDELLDVDPGEVDECGVVEVGELFVVDVLDRAVVVVDDAVVPTAVFTGGPSSPPSSAPLHPAITNRHEARNNPPDA